MDKHQLDLRLHFSEHPARGCSTIKFGHLKCYPKIVWPRGVVGSASDSRVRDPGFDTQSSQVLSFLLPLIQEGQLSVTGESMCTKYWLTAYEAKACPGKEWLGLS